mgnify:CR=1 FL=1
MSMLLKNRHSGGGLNATLRDPKRELWFRFSRGGFCLFDLDFNAVSSETMQAFCFFLLLSDLCYERNRSVVLWFAAIPGFDRECLGEETIFLEVSEDVFSIRKGFAIPLLS